MASEYVILQSSKKKIIEYTSEVSVKVSIASTNRSTRMMTRSMTKVVASIPPKQQAVTSTLQSCKTQKFGSNLPADRVNQTVFLPNLRLKSFGVFNMKKTPSYALDEFQAYTNNVFQHFDEEDDDYGSSDSSPASPRDSFFSQVEVKSSDTMFMPVMATEAINLAEELTNMKATLEKLSKENEEKDAQIKPQNKQIADWKESWKNGHLKLQTNA